MVDGSAMFPVKCELVLAGTKDLRAEDKRVGLE
ncbi:hypothetical protein PF005_g11624 [Phytophthora fragariae]|uniref:Uncharacterized protein n=1 Tax=Phytophthora fragariae TaxID=53985 RepID=A0A6A3XZU7_9STRA|nr:hypothetical protein PF003_g30450 [Phytophthora fragariae]KAE9009158.1 hypothetical protein PF011_g10399 [Phytophthora fragariae]KAE9093877.1 hypothetical protein PF010_g17315 [Phytophthora fragariae]KAE9206352.1 hypothetical protein PF004_g17320 [Phytophthora fragariae]KAE9209971.1 hypothetical protein PF005_g11624 [Phytophthora fragariae]